uniref:Uncharacterized protein n=1 Tax=Haptolina brevifila TaxID=156173 RepID=A0A6U7CC06_9EUKA
MSTCGTGPSSSSPSYVTTKLTFSPPIERRASSLTLVMVPTIQPKPSHLRRRRRPTSALLIALTGLAKKHHRLRQQRLGTDLVAVGYNERLLETPWWIVVSPLPEITTIFVGAVLFSLRRRPSCTE